jgi:hypothetical protein
LHQPDQSANGSIPQGLFLVRVQGAQYRWHPQKPFYQLRFEVLKPHELERKTFSGRMYCTPRALWKLSWFLRDFGYDPDLLGHDEVDEKQLVGLRGLVKVSYAVLHGTPLLNLDGFAPASQWEELPAGAPATSNGPEPAR